MGSREVNCGKGIRDVVPAPQGGGVVCRPLENGESA